MLPNLTLSSNIKPQLKNFNQTETMKKIGGAIESSLKTFASMNFVLSIWFEGMLNQILGLIQNLAVIVHFPLFDIPMPANL